MKGRNRKECERTHTRRDFLKTLVGSFAFFTAIAANRCEKSNQPEEQQEPPILGPRTGITNPFVNAQGNPILIDVNGNDFGIMLRAGLDALGGLEKLITSNSDVLIKPNLFEASQYPWISSPDSIVQVINEVKKVTGGNLNVGDMSFENTASVFQHLNLRTVINNAGGILLDFVNTHVVKRNNWPGSNPRYKVYADIYDSPVVINFPVLKRHYLAGLTCAIKNNVGTIEGSHASSSRNYMHNIAPDFMAELAYVASLTNPDLNIVDARSIVTEIGPYYSQHGTLVHLNKLVLCGDIVATDAYCAKLMAENDASYYAREIQSTLEPAEQLGIGTSNLNNIDVIEIFT